MEKQQASEKKLDAMRKQAGKLYSMSPKVWVNVNPTAASTNDTTFQIPSVVIKHFLRVLPDCTPQEGLGKSRENPITMDDVPSVEAFKLLCKAVETKVVLLGEFSTFEKHLSAACAPEERVKLQLDMFEVAHKLDVKKVFHWLDTALSRTLAGMQTPKLKDINGYGHAALQLSKTANNNKLWEEVKNAVDKLSTEESRDLALDWEILVQLRCPTEAANTLQPGPQEQEETSGGEANDGAERARDDSERVAWGTIHLIGKEWSQLRHPAILDCFFKWLSFDPTRVHTYLADERLHIVLHFVVRKCAALIQAPQDPTSYTENHPTFNRGSYEKHFCSARGILNLAKFVKTYQPGSTDVPDWWKPHTPLLYQSDAIMAFLEQHVESARNFILGDEEPAAKRQRSK